MIIKTLSLGVNTTNCYILIDEKTNKAVVIDPADNVNAILSALDNAEAHLEMILLTHGHYDHIQALDDLRLATNAPAGIHLEDEEMLYDAKKSHQLYYNGNTKPYNKIDFTFEEGQHFAVGNSPITVMHTPGHSKGSSCFIGNGFIISGDTLFAGSMGRYDLHGGNFTQIMASLTRLQGIDGNPNVYPGHGPATCMDDERRYNPYFLR